MPHFAISLLYAYVYTRKSACGEQFQHHLSACLFQIHQQVGRSILDYSQFAIRHEVLGECLLFIRLQPSEVGLVVSIYTCHQFNIRTVCICQIAVPSLTKVSISPCPLLLSGRDVVVSHVQNAGTCVILVSSDEVVL